MRSKLAGTKHFVVPHIGQPLGCREIAVIFRVVNCALWLRTGEALHLASKSALDDCLFLLYCGSGRLAKTRTDADTIIADGNVSGTW